MPGLLHSIRRKKSINDILSQSKVLDETHNSPGLKKVLNARDLTFFGIAAILGAGSFSSLGSAVYSGGPGVVILYILCGIACGFTAFCYAEFASRVPVAGSAYTYAYASFGELMAWIIGWALLMEYSIGNIYVSFSWSDYFTTLLSEFNIHIPPYLTCSYKEAATGIQNNTTSQELITAWNTSPMVGSQKIIVDLPAFVINILITYLVYKGVKESRNFSNVMVLLKLAAVALVILVGGALFLNLGTFENWTPTNESTGVQSFMPNGFGGVMTAVSGVFFAYIGFDAVSVLAEESKDPQRDLPKGMIWSLIICTVIYILLSLILTGAVHYSKFEGIGDPLAFLFQSENLNQPWMVTIIALIAVVAMTSVLLVFQLGQPRIWMTMSRDGLLPYAFQKIHPRYQTPSFATIVTGLVVGLPILFTDKTFVLDFTSIGTLFAFVLVCGGVLLLPKRERQMGKFHLPYFNSQYIFPIFTVATIVFLSINGSNYFGELFNSELESKLFSSNSIRIATIIFWVLMIVFSYFAFVKKYSLIPLLGMIFCLYLLTGMAGSNWFWFFVWFAIGLIIYFSYGFKKSKLAILTN